MDQHQHEQLDKLLAKAEIKRGLGRVDHGELTRLIDQADAEDKLLIRGASPGKAIFTTRGRYVAALPPTCPREVEVDR